MLELRRKFLKTSANALILPWIGTGLLIPQSVLAADWRRKAFEAGNIDDALTASNHEQAVETNDITINAPDIAENGARVEIEILSKIPDTRSLAIFADHNPTPLNAILTFSGQAMPYAKVQLKLAEDTRLRVVAKATDDKRYVAYRDIGVIVGGCGI